MFEYVKGFLENTNIKSTQLKKQYPFRNRYQHTLRMYSWAERVNQVEKGDDRVLRVAAIFHDIGKGLNKGHNHAETGAQICERYLLEKDFDQSFINKVSQAIRLHSSKTMPVIDLTLEDRIIIDADLLDETGAITVLWDAMDTGTKKEQGYNIVYQRLVKAYDQKEKLCQYLKTEEGKRLYQQRLEFLKLYISNLKYELGI